MISTQVNKMSVNVTKNNSLENQINPDDHTTQNNWVETI